NWKYRKGAGEAPGLLTEAVNGLGQVQSVRYWNLSRRAGSNSIYSHTASAPPSVLTPPSMANGPSLPGEAGKLDDSTRQLFADGNARFAGGSLVVVSSIEVDNGYNENGYQGRISTGYRYAGAVLDLQGRGFLGFREVRALNRNSGIETVNLHRQAFPFTGMVEVSWQKAPDATIREIITTELDDCTDTTGEEVYGCIFHPRYV